MIIWNIYDYVVERKFGRVVERRKFALKVCGKSVIFIRKTYFYYNNILVIFYREMRHVATS
eukprot:m.31182 g.31182  ORF g.31182 m.31182 type:complete len:61 (+) comp8289_c0_seq4:181-363(+)